MKHVEFTYVGGFETTIGVPDHQPLREIVESVLRQVKPGNPNYKVPIRVLINGGLVLEEDYNRIPANTDFVKIQEIQARSTPPVPLEKTGAEALFKQTLQDLRDLWDTLIRPIGRFFWWPWRGLGRGLREDPPDATIATIIVSVGVALQVLAVISVFEHEWKIFLGLVLVYCFITCVQYKRLKREEKVEA